MARSDNRNDKVGWGVYKLYLVCLFISFLMIGRLIYLQVSFEPPQKLNNLLTPQPTKQELLPKRGNILAEDGRPLAMTVPEFTIYMDCAVQKDDWAKEGAKGAENEAKWMEKAGKLAEGLAGIIGEKTASQYYSMIKSGRDAGKRYLKICENVDLKTYNRLIELPLFNEPGYKGGMIVEKEDMRVYPYGELARRAIGFVRSNKSTVGNTHVGIEGKFDFDLHGSEGYEYVKISDNNAKIRDFSMDALEAVDGMDIRTTLNIDYQDIADKALRSHIEDEEDIEGGCVVLMDVKTGAIRAMVNLLRDEKSGSLGETQNIAIGRRMEPGSVFKTVTLTSLLSDGYVTTLDETMNTNDGKVKGTDLKPDQEMIDYQREHKSRQISILDGFKMSSNYVFATLALRYSDKPQKFIDNIYSYKLGEAFDFDLEGLREPHIPAPNTVGWSLTTLGSVGFGYSTMETPLHILTFYNALANKGKMMKPYIVECTEKNGVVDKKRGPSVLNASICSKAVADTVTRALAAVTEDGTARRLKDARCNVAGKTGTSFGIFETNAKTGDAYKDVDGRQKYQGTFVGFFPTEDPLFSIICHIYTKPTTRSFQGGGIPAATVKDIVNGIWEIGLGTDDILERTGEMGLMTVPEMAEMKEGEVPDVKGLGLKDAVFRIENAGYGCTYTGTGHVSSQSIEGDTVKLVLK